MQTSQSVHTVPGEWNWVIGFSLILTSVISIPFIWVGVNSVTQPEWTFMGIISNYRDGATYLSKIRLGIDGHWITTFRHTPDDHSGAYVALLYNTLGQVANPLRLSPGLVFHAARILATLLMYLTLYNLGATVWRRQRPRRTFFVIASLGSGFGTFLLPFTQNSPDVVIPEAFPLYSSMVNVHFPLAFGGLALMTSVIVRAFRPGYRDAPTFENGGVVLFLASLLLAIIYPHALVPFVGGLGLLILIESIKQRSIAMWQVRWLMMIVIPAVPMAVYYGTQVSGNEGIMEWTRQNVTAAPSIPVYFLGFGLPLMIAAPGIYRALRHFEADGDQFVVLWLVVMFVASLLPVTDIQRRFSVGAMLPIAYFAVRSLEDFWWQRIARKRQRLATIIVMPFVVLTYGLLLATWIYTAAVPTASPSYLDSDYAAAMDWIDGRPGEPVILASPNVSVWLPGAAGVRVVYGHPFETFFAEDREANVLAWYRNEADDCLSYATEVGVRYVIVGPEERDIGTAPCTDELDEAWSQGDVTIYAVNG